MHGFEGFMHFNSQPYSDRVGVLCIEHGVFFSPKDKNQILRRGVSIYPIPSGALVKDAKSMRAGFFYSVEGTDVGACSESIGHPADGEFLVRDVLQFTIAAKYTFDELTLGVTGRTGEGREIHRGQIIAPPNVKLQLALTFRIEVRIPREAIAETLNLVEKERYDFYVRLDQLKDLT